MSNPYNIPGNVPPPPAPIPGRQGPRWARKRFVLPALGLAFVLGIAIGDGGQGDGKDPVVAAPTPTATVTATTTATATATVTAAPEPAPTVTVSATRTVTAEPAVDTDTGSVTGSDDGSDSGGDVYYQNCTAARAAGAAPVHAGDPGYGRHLDRDGDGVGCE
jgi:hypothetical protein